jgi:glycosyl transferase family 4
LLYVGGEDHHLRIPFMLAIRECGFQATAAGSGDSTPFRRAGVDFRPFKFNRYMSPFADWTAVKALSTMLRELQPDLAQSFDTKPNLLLPLAARAVGHPAIVRTITGVGWVYSSHSPLALLARPVLRALNRAAAQSTAATVFEIHDDQVFFDSQHMTGKNGLVIGGSILKDSGGLWSSALLRGSFGKNSASARLQSS